MANASIRHANRLCKTIGEAQSALDALKNEMGALPKGMSDRLRNITVNLESAALSASQFREDLDRPWLFQDVPVNGTA